MVAVFKTSQLPSACERAQACMFQVTNHSYQLKKVVNLVDFNLTFLLLTEKNVTFKEFI